MTVRSRSPSPTNSPIEASSQVVWTGEPGSDHFVRAFAVADRETEREVAIGVDGAIGVATGESEPIGGDIRAGGEAGARAQVGEERDQFADRKRGVFERGRHRQPLAMVKETGDDASPRWAAAGIDQSKPAPECCRTVRTNGHGGGRGIE